MPITGCHRLTCWSSFSKRASCLSFMTSCSPSSCRACQPLTIIEKRPGRKYTALVTSNYHIYRAMRYAKRAHLKAVGIGSRVAPYYYPSALIREFVAVHKERKHLILFAIGYLLFVSPVIVIMLVA